MKIIHGGGELDPFKCLLAAVALVVLAALVLSLAGCAHEPETRTVVKTEFVDREVPTQVALDGRLTSAPARPGPPTFKCTDRENRPTICGEDLIDALQRWQKAGGDAIEQVKAIKALQPKEGA